MPKFSSPQPRIHLKKKKPTDKFGYLVLSIRFNNKQLTYSLTDYLRKEKVNFIIDSRYWNSKVGQTSFSKQYGEDYKAVNDSIKKIKEHIDKQFKEKPDLTHQELKQELHFFTGKDKRKEEKKGKSFWEFIDLEIEKRKKRNIKDNTTTWKRFLTTKNKLREYAKDKDIELNYDSIDLDFKYDFVEWLYEAPRELGTNYVSKIIQNLKNFLQESYEKEFHTNTAFLSKKFVEKQTETKTKTRLSFDEIAILQEMDFSNNPTFEKVRDLFVAHCYTGFRISDWNQATRENIKVNIKGTGILKIIPSKTRKTKKGKKREVEIPVLPVLEEILKKYNYQLPSFTDQYFNRVIKKVCKAAGFTNLEEKVIDKAGIEIVEKVEKWTMVASHCARRSFATNFYLFGIPASLVMKMTGHSTEKQFFAYIDIDAEDAANQFAEQAEKIEILRKSMKNSRSPLRKVS